eukprot:gene19586-26269_t
MTQVIVDALFQHNIKKILVVDKAPDFDIECINVLARDVARAADVNVSIKHVDDFKTQHSRSSSILAIIRKTKEVVIVFADKTSKCSPLPKEIHCAANKIILLYVHTMLKKLPYAKKHFDKILVINDEDDENQYIRMTNSLVGNRKTTTRLQIEDIQVHDLNMIALILLQNMSKLNLAFAKMQKTYEILTCSELFSNHEDNPITSYIQVFCLMSTFKASRTQCKKLDFTQHLSKYSVQSATKKKQQAKADFISSSNLPYENMVVSPDCPDELKDIQRLFFAAINAT